MTINGADVSSWQLPTLDYTGLDFVYVKITQGTYVANPNHDAQVAHARELGLIVGHYHFPGWGDPVAEARAFWANCNAQPGDFLVLDIEDSQWTPWPRDPVSWCCRFEDELQRLSGTWAMDYAGWNVRTTWDWTALAQRGGGLIVPAYNPIGPGSPAPWAAVAMWQNADTNVSGGDSDIFFGDRAALTAYGIGGLSSQSTSVTPISVPTIPKDEDPMFDATAEGQLTMTLDDAHRARGILESIEAPLHKVLLDRPRWFKADGNDTIYALEAGKLRGMSGTEWKLIGRPEPTIVDQADIDAMPKA